MDPEDRTSPDEFSPGDSFGQYEILKLIGVGGMARVYRARDPHTGREVAVKIMERSLLRSAAGRRRFLREGATAASVKHSNVVAMLEVGSIEDLPFIVMEHLRGRDLDTYIRMRGPLAESDVVALALPVISGMAAVHRAGVVHRDIKPSNIFLATGDSGLAIPKLLDFGISKVHGGMFDADTGATGSREIIGTPAYLAPEALNGSRQLGPLSDQYSLGVVLYECLVGRSPYAGLSLLDLLQALGSGKLQSPKSVRVDISDELNSIICRMLAAKPANRFDSIEDVGRAIWLRAEEPARAIWASEFGAQGYTIPLTGAGQSGVGLGEGVVRSSPGAHSEDTGTESPSGAARGRWWRPAIAAVFLLGLVSFWLIRASETSFVNAVDAESPAGLGTRPGRVISGLKASDSAVVAEALELRSASRRQEDLAQSPEDTGPMPNAHPPAGEASIEGAESIVAPEASTKALRNPDTAAVKAKNSRKRRARRERRRRPRRTRTVAAPEAPVEASDSEQLSAAQREDRDLSELFGSRKERGRAGRQDRSRWGANDSPILD